MITRRLHVLGLALAALFVLPPTLAAAADTQVAVAANFTEPAKEIAAAFKASSGHTAILSFGSSGQFYSQIAHGAPYEVFLSADADRPKKAEQDGVGVTGTRFTYAIGRLALYSKDAALVDQGGAILGKGRFAKVAIADPALAPYGVAAVQTMRKLGVYEKVKPKIVMGTSIAQTYQFVHTGAAELGFVAWSQVINEPSGSRWLVPLADHTPIVQQAILLYPGQSNAAAKAFLTFLRSPTALQIIKKHGYEAP